MSWTNKLIETYDVCNKLVGKEQDGCVLIPFSHLNVKAQIEVVLNEEGEIVSAREISNEDSTTIIPVTEDSAGRTKRPEAHPLHDKLIYLAGDYEKYFDKNNDENLKLHNTLLKKWKNSEFSAEIVDAVYSYLQKGKLIEDLIQLGIFPMVNGKVDISKKFQKTVKLSECFIRFRLSNFEKNFEYPWRDLELFKKYHTFYSSLKAKEEKKLCYVTGEYVYCTQNHPKNLRKGNDKAKLISANDTKNFTFRGRIKDKEYALSIGYEASQKIHNTLRWLIEKQGYQKFGQTLVVWNAHCDKIVSPLDAFDFKKTSYRINTEKDFAKQLNVMIGGYRQNISDWNDSVTILSMAAATPGRFSITYYQEISPELYYQYIQNWYKRCSWIQFSSRFSGFGTPSLQSIITHGYGTLRGDFFDIDEKLMNMHLSRLLPCITENKNIPYDLIIGLMNQIKTTSKTDISKMKETIGILCAVFKKYCFDLKKEEWSINIMENEKKGLENLSYLLGRYLAVYDVLEEYALHEQGQIRPTNAMKYYASFQERPFQILPIIDKNVRPYIVRLGNKAKYLLKMKEEIATKIKNYIMNFESLNTIQNLDSYFVLGFDCQKNEIQLENQRRQEKKLKKEDL